MASSPPSNSTSSINGSWSDCAENLGETTCGSICCATGQYCSGESQCEDFPSIVCEPSLNGPCIIIQTTSVLSSTPMITSSAAPTSSDVSSSSLPATTTSSTWETSSLVTTTSDLNTTANSSTGVATISEPTAIVSSSTTFAVAASTKNPFSGNPISTSAPAPSQAASSSPNITSKTGFKVGVPLAAISILAVLAFLAIFFYRRRRNRRETNVRPPVGEITEDFGPIRHSNYGPINAPIPNPYDKVFPHHRSPIGSRSLSPLRGNRSRFNSDLAPDHDNGFRRPQTNLRHAPALSPYGRAFPAADMRGGLSGDGESTFSTAPPSYMSSRRQ